MDKKYYTVAEFAKKVGISRQAVYKKTVNELAKYCQVVDGQKVILKAALNLFDTSKLTENPLTEASSIDKIVSLFASQSAEKDEQLREKELQLARKDEQIEKLQEQITELTKAFRESQALHAGTLQRELGERSNANNKHRWWKFGGRNNNK